jgi:regulator of replication initiation timing
VRGSPEQLVYRKLLTTSSESLESSSSPEDGNFSSGVIPTQFYSRSRPNESFNASNQSVSREGLEQLKSLQRRIDSLQQKINALEIENSHLKKTLAPVPEVVEGETREDLMENILDMEEDIGKSGYNLCYI